MSKICTYSQAQHVNCQGSTATSQKSLEIFFEIASINGIKVKKIPTRGETLVRLAPFRSRGLRRKSYRLHLGSGVDLCTATGDPGSRLEPLSKEKLKKNGFKTSKTCFPLILIPRRENAGVGP